MLRRSLRLEPPYWFAFASAVPSALRSCRRMLLRKGYRRSRPARLPHTFSICRRYWPIVGPTSFSKLRARRCCYAVPCCCGLCRATIRPKPMQGRATALTFAGAALIGLFQPISTLRRPGAPSGIIAQFLVSRSLAVGSALAFHPRTRSNAHRSPLLCGPPYANQAAEKPRYDLVEIREVRKPTRWIPRRTSRRDVLCDDAACTNYGVTADADTGKMTAFKPAQTWSSMITGLDWAIPYA
jgi:hypothetical protein